MAYFHAPPSTIPDWKLRNGSKNSSAIRGESRYTVIRDLADEVKGFSAGISRDFNRCLTSRAFHNSDDTLVRPRFWLNPPFIGQCIAIGIGCFGSIEVDRRPWSGIPRQNIKAAIAFDYHDRISITLTVFRPIHAGGKIVEYRGFKIFRVNLTNGVSITHSSSVSV